MEDPFLAFQGQTIGSVVFLFFTQDINNINGLHKFMEKRVFFKYVFIDENEENCKKCLKKR